MVAFHKEFRVSLTIADEVMFRNKISTDGVLTFRLENDLPRSQLSATMTLTRTAVAPFRWTGGEEACTALENSAVP
jgi:hypothetical protein